MADPHGKPPGTEQTVSDLDPVTQTSQGRFNLDEEVTIRRELSETVDEGTVRGPASTLDAPPSVRELPPASTAIAEDDESTQTQRSPAALDEPTVPPRPKRSAPGRGVGEAPVDPSPTGSTRRELAPAASSWLTRFQEQPLSLRLTLVLAVFFLLGFGGLLLALMAR